MPEFLVVTDRDEDRRARTVAETTTRLAELTANPIVRLDGPWVTAMVAAGPRAPLTTASSPAGGALVLGLASRGRERLTAELLVPSPYAPPGPVPRLDFDGFALAVSWTPRAGLAVEADVAGILPVYWWSDGATAVVASSPWLILAAEGVRTEPDPQGLAGILLTNGLVGGRTLWRGISRLEDNARLLIPPSGPPVVEQQVAIPASDAGAGLSYPEQVDLLADATMAALDRMVPPGNAVGLMLSGGLDSRLLAGTLHALGRPVDAMTFGQPADVEMRCAARVASLLGFRHFPVEPPVRQAPLDSIRWRIRRDQLASGLFGAAGRDRVVSMARLPASTVSGYGLDFVLSPVPVFSGGRGRARDKAFESLFHRLNRWGLRPGDVTALLGSPAPVEGVMADLRDYFDRQPGLPSDAGWRAHIGTRGRFFSSSVPWHVADGSWPVVPVLDRQFLATVAGMPQSTLAERKAEQEIIRRRFPALARLPLDRNSDDPLPLSPTLWYLVARAVRWRLQAVSPGRKWTARLPYYRESDFNGPGWREVRTEADRCREAVSGLVDRAVLDRLLPTATAIPEFKDPIIHSSGLKLLVGLVLWASEFQ